MTYTLDYLGYSIRHKKYGKVAEIIRLSPELLQEFYRNGGNKKPLEYAHFEGNSLMFSLIVRLQAEIEKKSIADVFSEHSYLTNADKLFLNDEQYIALLLVSGDFEFVRDFCISNPTNLGNLIDGKIPLDIIAGQKSLNDQFSQLLLRHTATYYHELKKENPQNPLLGNIEQSKFLDQILLVADKLEHKKPKAPSMTLLQKKNIDYFVNLPVVKTPVDFQHTFNADPSLLDIHFPFEDEDHTLITCAFEKDDVDLFKELVTFKARREKKSTLITIKELRFNELPLLFCAARDDKHLNMLNYLLKITTPNVHLSDLGLNTSDYRKKISTPLHAAFYHGAEHSKNLLLNVADVTILNDEGKRAHEYGEDKTLTQFEDAVKAKSFASTGQPPSLHIPYNTSYLAVPLDGGIALDLVAKNYHSTSPSYKRIFKETALLYIDLVKSNRDKTKKDIALQNIEASPNFEKIKNLATCLEIEEIKTSGKRDSELDDLFIGIQTSSKSFVKSLIHANPGLLAYTRYNLIPAVWANKNISSFWNGEQKEIARFLHSETKILLDKLTLAEKLGHTSYLLYTLQSFTQSLDEIDEKSETYLPADFFEAIRGNNFEKVRKYVFHNDIFLVSQSPEGMPLEMAEKLGNKGKELLQFLLAQSTELFIKFAQTNSSDQLELFLSSKHFEQIKERAKKLYHARNLQPIDSNNNNEKSVFDLCLENIDRQRSKRITAEEKLEQGKNLINAVRTKNYALVKQLTNNNKHLLCILIQSRHATELVCQVAYQLLIKGKKPNRDENNIFRFLLSETLLLKRELELNSNKTQDEKNLLANFNKVYPQIEAEIISEIKKLPKTMFTQAIEENNFEKMRIMAIISPDLIYAKSHHQTVFALDLISDKTEISKDIYSYFVAETALEFVKVINNIEKFDDSIKFSPLMIKDLGDLQTFKAVYVKAQELYKGTESFLSVFQSAIKKSPFYYYSDNLLTNFTYAFNKEISGSINLNYEQMVHEKIQSLENDETKDELTKITHLLKYLEIMCKLMNNPLTAKKIQSVMKSFADRELNYSAELREIYSEVDEKSLEEEVKTTLASINDRESLARFNLHNVSKKTPTQVELETRADQIFGL